MLIENERRLAAINAPYDPIAAPYPDAMKRELDATSGSLSEDELHQLRCRHDFPYWAATSVYIKKKGGGEDIPFILNRSQRRLVAMLEEMRLADLPIRIILLKARQWGASTCIQLYMAWLQLCHRTGLNSLIIAHVNSASDEIKDMFDRMLSRYPQRLTVKRVGKAGGTIRIVERNCKLKTGSAESPDSCRGGDYNLVHCSEVGLWRATRLRTPEQIVRSACSGVLLKPLTMIAFESTANGTGTFFYNEYQSAAKGESQFRPLFVPWYEIEQYSLPFPPGERERFARRLYEEREADQPLSDRRQPGRYLWWLWEKGATLEAIHWYVTERAKYSDHAQMAAEYPSDDVEAFAHSGARVFDKYKVDELKRCCNLNFERGEVVGDAPFGPASLRNVRFSPCSSGALVVWKRPEQSRETRITDRYLTVVDIGGRSQQADWSVIAVIDRAPMRYGEPPEIVAQWRGHTDFDLLAWNAARIAAFYDNALLVVESNTLETSDPERFIDGNQSSFLLNQLRDAYDNLYARRRSEEDIRNGAPLKYGFHTNSATKPMVISTLVQAVREGLYVERDAGCIAELMTYEQRQNGSYGALAGHHDDILMTRAIGLHICFYEMEPPREVSCIASPRSSLYRRPRSGSAAIF